MYDLNKIVNGIVKYIDLEILSKTDGWQKWAFGIMSGLVLNHSKEMLDKLKNNPFIASTDIIDENDRVNIEELYSLAIKEAKKGSINVMIPMLGSINFDDTDVTKLYEYIKNEQ